MFDRYAVMKWNDVAIPGTAVAYRWIATGLTRLSTDISSLTHFDGVFRRERLLMTDLSRRDNLSAANTNTHCKVA